MPLKPAALYAAFAVNLYVLGAMLVFALVSYPAVLADRSGYPAFTRAIGFSVVPFEFLAFLVPLILYAVKPEPLSAVHVAVGLGVVYFAITFGWHLPAHRPLAAGSAESASALMASQWTRTAVQLARAGILGWLALK